MSNDISRSTRRLPPSSTYSPSALNSAQGTRAVSRLNAIVERGAVDQRLPRTALTETFGPPSQAEIAATAVHGANPVDLAPLNGAATDHLIAQLTRIEYLVDQATGGADASEAGDAQSLTIGAGMIGETIRRLRLVQSAGDKLVVGDAK